MECNVRRFVLLACCLLFAVKVQSQGPVFINPEKAAEAAQTAQSASGNQEIRVTQTVYGFLDFTTTIGNTVMIFSPQSASGLVPPEAKPQNEITSNNVIETKPIVTKIEAKINPSKTQVSKDQKSIEKKVVSVVQVQSNAPQTVTSKVEIKSSATSKKEERSKIKELKPVISSSKVQVVGGSTSSKTVVATASISTKVEIVSGSTKLVEPIIASKVESRKEPESSIVSSIVHVKSDNEPAAIIGNNIGDPEYDFLSRQPSEVVEETFKVINLKPSSKFLLKHRPATELKKHGATKRGDAHPTGLVTKLGGTVVKDGITTIIETSVIGTYISGKYAQVLQSTSKKIQPTQSLRILKTASPSLSKGNKQRHIDSTTARNSNEHAPALPNDTAQNTIKSARKPSGAGVSYKRFKNRHKESDVTAVAEEDNEPAPNYKKSQKNRSQLQLARNSKHHTTTHRPQQKFNGSRNRKHPTTSKPSVHSEELSTNSSGKRYSGRRTSKSTKTPSESSTSTSSAFTRRGYKPKVQPSAVDAHGSSSSLYKFKLNRSPGRWQYKTTSKPRVTIRKQNSDEAANNNEALGTTSSSPMPPAAAAAVQEVPQSPINDVVTSQSRSDDIDSLEGSESIASIIDDESATANKLEANPVAPAAFPVETIKVEISTPSDFGDIYYEIATIKSPYTFQVGSVKNTRYVTVTSTFEKSLEHTTDPVKVTEPLTENILATSTNYAKDNNFLDSSISTLPPLYLASDMETPPLETLTETFSTTHTMLKTHILPVVRNKNETSSSTLVQTYLITRLVTATKTLPPLDAYHFIPSKTLNEFNSHLDEAGSELHLELEFGDQNDQEDGVRKVSLPADLDLANIGSNFDLIDVDKTKVEAHLRHKKPQSPAKPALNDLNNQQLSAVSPDQLNQLALYRLLNPNAAGQPQVITTSKPVIKIETLYETFILPVTQGHNTIQSTISKLKGTITKTEYEFGTSTIGPTFPQLPLQPLQPQLPQLNPFLPQAQPQFTVTSSPVVQTATITQTNSKVLKLTFGAKTARTTIYSTTVIPTVTTSYVTASVQVPAAGAFPGYFPAPYPPYPYVG